ncbi:small subunit ribosomal protein S20 [Hydrogenispora ethanolica]|uniref:Small ribosomal subunit protein bS20 n=1 Tax=Hydrogenispora ethanolica TaxID=1082276 RepID=A0A4R1REE5_HYDET|nr:30S ribosomal protein S20 [Hydrogenispora ethanolica]TCL64271.1 small subunit ribosomal protein S20 [Hydrogenispora ethanolica]
MPNIKSAEKRVKVAAINREANKTQRSELKTYLKKAVSSITAGNKDAAKSDLQQAIKSLDESASKGLIHKNQAARRKSRLMKKLNAM